ncbi:MAG: hypothetical protein KAS80_05140 [Anaerolineales bacterium]|nr:hypothetical protein [Anaerolineales bacterium]
MELKNIERVWFVTSNYSSLQGLKILPLGVWLYLEAAGNFSWIPLYTHNRPISSLLLLCIACGGWLIVSHWYNRVFGYVGPTKQGVLKFTWTSIMVVVVSFPWLLISGVIDGALKPPVSALGLTASFLLALWWAVGRLPKHYAIAAALIAIVSILPLFGIVSKDQYFSGLISLVFGTILIMVGILDHLQLVHKLGDSPAGHDD